MKKSLVDQLPKASFLPVLMTIVCCLLAVLTPLTIVNTALIWSISSRKKPTLVQLANGSSASVVEKDHNYRSVLSIHKFLNQTFTNLYHWDGKTVDDLGRTIDDEYVKFSGGQIPTTTYNTRFAFTDKGQLGYQIMEQIEEIHDQSFINGSKTQSFRIQHLDQPRVLKDKPGWWTVRFFATRTVHFNGLDYPITYNRKITLKATPVQRPKLDTELTAEHEAFYKIADHGLTIMKMETLPMES